MNMLRKNWAFVLLVGITLLLVILLISLQSAILSNQAGNQPANAGPLYGLRQQLALWIAPATNTPTITPTTLPTTPPTATPLPPTITATAAALPTDTATVPAPTETPTVTTAPPLEPSATATAPSLVPTATPMAAQVEANVPQTAGQTTARADYRLGYFERDDRCSVITEIARLILTQNFGLSVESVPFTSADALFDTLAATNADVRVDLTFCYRDPTDRSHLQEHFGFVILVGGAYRQAADASYLIVTNAAVKKVIQRDQPCIHTMLTDFQIVEAEIQAQDAASWYASHVEQINRWAQCQ